MSSKEVVRIVGLLAQAPTAPEGITVAGLVIRGRYLHQVEILNLLTDLNRRRGSTITLAMHDLNLAARAADHLIAMRDGRIAQQGTPHEVITAETMREVFSRWSRPDSHQSSESSLAPDHEIR